MNIFLFYNLKKSSPATILYPYFRLGYFYPVADFPIIEYKPDPDPRKQDYLHITIKFRKDEVLHSFYLEITHAHGTSPKNVSEKILDNVVKIVPKEELWTHIQPVRKIKKMYDVPEQLKFYVKIYSMSGIGDTKKYNI